MHWWKKNRRPVIQFGAHSDVGVVRVENQDTFGHFSRRLPTGIEEHLFVVADGMGGHARGQEASQIAVEAIRETYFAGPESSVGAHLKHAFETANARIFAQSQTMQLHDRMGTTCTALALSDDKIQIAHVGDSRAYRITSSGIEQLTHDHTHVEELRVQGILTEAEAKNHPHRNALTRAMGIGPELEVDLSSAMHVEAKEWYLLCSDGLLEVPGKELEKTVRSMPPQQACETLVEKANERGGRDNVTVIVVEVA